MSELKSFKDYNHYVSEQTRVNKRKIKNVFAGPQELKDVTDYIKEYNPKAKNAICHGTRNGFEIKEFKKNLGIDVIGTEISDTATQFPDTIQWDFHEVKGEWLNNIDVIYSNSLDHSIDPAKAVASWIQCLSLNGLCFIEWTFSSTTSATKREALADCYGATKEEYIKLVEDNGGALVYSIQHNREDHGIIRQTLVFKRATT